MRETPRARLVAYGVAVLATAVSLLARWPLRPVLGDAVPHMTFFPAVMVAAYFGGLGPGLLATVLSTVAANYILTKPLADFRITGANDVTALILFVLTGVVISGLCESLHRARGRILADERQRADEALSQERYLLHTLMDNLPDVIYFKDAASRFLRINKALATYFGLSDPAAAIGKTDFEFFTQDHTQLTLEDEREIIRTGRPLVEKEEKRVWLDGRVRWLSTTKMPLRDKGGTIIGTFGVSRNITERKRAEEALRQANARVELAVRSSNISIWECDMPDGRIENAHVTLFNVWESLGYDARTMPTDFSSACAGFFHPDDLERVGRAIQELLASDGQEWKNEYRALTKDGSTRWLLARGTVLRDPDGKPVRFIGTSTDITDRKRAEEALQESEERFRTLAKATNDAVWDWDLSTNKIWWNEGVHTLFGYRLEEDTSDPAWWLERVHPEDRAAVEAFFFDVVRGKELTWVDEYRFRCADGSYKNVYDRGYVLRSAEGQATRMIGAMLDITDRKRAEEALQESEQRWRSLAEALPQLVWTDTPDGYCDYLSTQWEKYTGVPAAEHFGSRWMEAIHPDDLERVRHCWTEAVAGRADYDVEFRIRRADGEYRWFKARGVPVRDSAGEIVKWFGTCTDITDLRQTQEALRQANARLDLAVRGSNISIWECDMPDGRIENSRLTLINTLESLGYDAQTSPSDFPSTFTLLFHPDDQERVTKELEALFCGDGHHYDSEYRVRTKEGTTRWHLARGTVLRDPEGKSVRFIGTSTDITDRKRAEEALRESEQRFRVFVDHAADAFFLNDERGRILDANQCACESLGYTRDELIGMTPFDFVSNLTPAVFAARLGPLLAGETLAVENDHRRKDGTTFPVEVRAKIFWEGARAFFVTLARDISERKRLEEEVHLASARLELALRGSNIGFWDIDMPDGDLRNGRVHYVNVWEQLGYERPDSPKDQETGMALVHPDDRVAHSEAARRYLAGETSEFEVETRVCHKDGSFRWMISRGVAVRDAGGKPSRFLGTGIDITDRKRAEEALRESEERFRQLAENVRGVFWLQEDEWQRLLYISPVFEEFWGRTCQSLYEQPRSWIDSVHPDDRELVFAHFEQQNRGTSTETDFRITRHDGSMRWMRCRAFPLKNLAGEVYRVGGLVEDITASRQFEEELRRAKEAAESANRAKDEFLANVSHEIRTPMNAILGMTELALDTPLTEDQRQYLRTVKSAADSLLGLINDLLDFSKIEAGKLELDLADFSLRASLGDALRALAVRAHRKGLELISQVRPDVPDALVGDAGRLRQVLLNLVGNAIKFTEEGEVAVQVSLASRERERPEEEQPPVAHAPGLPVICFTVRDTGIGIPKEQQERIFRAFEQEDASTTRRYGGTGLGLSIASRLVALMGGRITVNSQPGRGSTFTFTARFGRQPQQPEPAAARPPTQLDGQPVLVVDDNATNRRILEEWLRGWRMAPATAGDGLAALNALWRGAAGGRPYALVLLDARMPDTDGLTLAAMIREKAELSTTRIILLTSGDRHDDWARLRELRIDAYLLKPVQQEELLETIHRVMSRTNGEEPAAQPMLAREPDPTPAAPALHILVAEDNEFSAQLLEQLLVRRGYRVRLAADGREALALASGGAHDLLLLDVHMPELDGFQVVRAIREGEQTAGGHLPVIALTARSRDEDRERCLAASMDDFLTKPVPSSRLYAAIDRLMSAHAVSWRPGGDAGEATSLLDPLAVLTACGDDAEGLLKMCRDFRTYAPAGMAEVAEALRDGDAPRLREAAHKLCSLLSAFSTVAGDVASDLEDRAAQGQLDEARPLVERLEAMVSELMPQVDGLSVETLRRQVEESGGRGRANEQ